jgi:pimeloyl-ACP methyl ester carboxylesterase
MISKKVRVTLKRIFWVFVPAVLVLGIGVVLLDFYVLYRLAHPPRAQLYGTPRDFQVIFEKPMWSEEKWKNQDETESVGWFLNQGKPAPSIIVSHAYGSNRSELLTLAFELWKTGYNVLLFDLRGHGESSVKWCGLGMYEKDDVLSAIKHLKTLKNEAGQELLDGRIGLYGVGLGGYASLAAFGMSTDVKTLVIDSPYKDANHFINDRFKNNMTEGSEWAHRLADSPWTARLTELMMQTYLMRREDSAPPLQIIGSSSDKRILFITGKDAGTLQETTRELFNQAKCQKDFAEVEQTRLDRLYNEKSQAYDARVVAFFKEAMPSSLDDKAKKK